MRRSPKIFLLALALINLSIGAAEAQNNEIFGTWVSVDEEEIMYLEPRSVGFNEHTVCTPKSPFPQSLEFRVKISCANFYFEGEKTIRAFEETKMFGAKYIAPNNLEITFGSEGEPVLYRRFSD
ncbi:MAG: hypothetical protein L3J21_10025 [Devosiaceae bacterium]|nr:hypothetical protein [Devosiaceae bacterium]